MKIVYQADGYTVYKTIKNGRPHMFIVNENEFNDL